MSKILIVSFHSFRSFLFWSKYGFGWWFGLYLRCNICLILADALVLVFAQIEGIESSKIQSKMDVLDVFSPSHRIFPSVASHLFVAIHHGDELSTHTTHAASQHDYTLHNIQHDSVKLMELGIACIIIPMKLSFSIDIVRSHFHAICAGTNKNDRGHVSLYIEMPFEKEGFFLFMTVITVFFYIQTWQFYNSPCKAFWLLLINVSNCVYNSPRTQTSKLLKFKWCFQSKYCEALASFPCCFPVFASIMKVSSGNETIESSTLILSCSHLNKQFSFAFIWFDDRISIDFLC